MKIAIVDDHPLVRKGLYVILSTSPDMEIIGEASDTKGALELIASKKPDIVLVDLRLGTENGLQVVRQAKTMGFLCKFMIITSSAKRLDFAKAEEAQVDGYILKEALPEEIIFAIGLVGRGRKFYDPNMLEIILEEKDESKEKLTSREKEILAVLGKGLSNQDIAKKLYITEFTVKKHVSQILSKLNLSDRTQAALYANSTGLADYGNNNLV